MHRLHRVRFPVALPRGGRGDAARALLQLAGFRDFEVEIERGDPLYFHPWILNDVAPQALEARWLDVRDLVAPLGGTAFPPYILWHAHRVDGYLHYYPKQRRVLRNRTQKCRAMRHRERLLRDKQRILDRCSTTAHD